MQAELTELHALHQEGLNSDMYHEGWQQMSSLTC